jgi:hypothetical protein
VVWMTVLMDYLEDGMSSLCSVCPCWYSRVCPFL